MNRLIATMKKSFLVLMRNKLSSFAILFGPLLIILLLGIAFTGQATLELNVGTYTPEKSELTDRFIASLNTQNLNTKEFESIDECTKQIKQGTIQMCVEFPSNFIIENDKTNEVIFYVDDSRTNFVYNIIDKVSSNIGVESAKLSEDLTEDILTILWRTEEGITDGIGQTILLKTQTDTLTSNTDDVSQKIDSQNLQNTDFSTSSIENSFEDLEDDYKDFRTEAQSLANDAKDVLNTLSSEAYAGAADTSGLNASISEIESLISSKSEDQDLLEDEFSDALSSLSGQLEDVNAQFVQADEIRQETKEKIATLKEDIATLKNDADALKVHLEDLNNQINQLKVTSKETIANPLVTTIKPVTSNKNNLSFTFPYLIMVVVLFIGLLLSSTLIVMEKLGKSSFRRFATPAPEATFLAANVLTSLTILTLQLIILLAIAYHFIGSTLLENILPFASLLLLATIFFILLGTLLGYLFNTQEAVTMVSIALGSILIFTSNLVLPLETLSKSLQNLALYNPFVLASEGLRKILLFKASFDSLSQEFSAIGILALTTLVVIIILQSITKSSRVLKVLLRKKHDVKNPNATYLQLGDAYIKDLEDFLDWIKNVDAREFESQFQWKEFRIWLKHVPNYRALRVKLAGKNKRQITNILEKWIKK